MFTEGIKIWSEIISNTQLSPCVPPFCPCHILTSSVSYYQTDTQQHGICTPNFLIHHTCPCWKQQACHRCEDQGSSCHNLQHLHVQCTLNKSSFSLLQMMMMTITLFKHDKNIQHGWWGRTFKLDLREESHGKTSSEKLNSYLWHSCHSTNQQNITNITLFNAGIPQTFLAGFHSPLDKVIDKGFKLCTG